MYTVAKTVSAGALFLLLLLSSASSFAATRYAVYTGGAASGSCGVSAPCTLDRARAQSVTAGDIVYLNPGTYTEGINTQGNGTAGNVILFECLGDLGDCILDGFAQGSTDRVLLIDSSFVTFSKLIIIVPPATGTGDRYGARSEASTTNITIVDSKFYATTNSTNVTNIQRAIQIRGTSFFVSRNEIYNVQVGINVNNDAGNSKGIVSYNKIYDLDQNDEEDADCINIGSTQRDHNYELVIAHNDCSGYPDDGIDLWGATNAIVEHNYVHDSGQSTTSNTGVKAGGCTLTTSSGNIIRNNRILVKGGGTQNDYGISTNGLSNGVITGNLVEADATVAAIEVSECGISPFGGGDDVLITNNTLIGNIGIYVRATAGGATGTIAKNNILVGSGSDINVETGMTLTGNNNILGGTGTTGGAGTYNGTNDIVSSPGFQDP